MRLTSLAIACLLAAGCMQTTKVGESAKLADATAPVAAKGPAPMVPAGPQLTRDDCYTVVLFDKIKIKKPGADVPPQFAAFSGAWQKGAWAGEWCAPQGPAALENAVALIDRAARDPMPTGPPWNL